MAEITVKRQSGFQSKTREVSIVFIVNTTLKNIVSAVAKIMPTMAGRIPLSVAFTPAYFNSFVNSVAVKRMIKKEGRITPRVASNAPSIFPFYSRYRLRN